MIRFERKSVLLAGGLLLASSGIAGCSMETATEEDLADFASEESTEEKGQALLKGSALTGKPYEKMLVTVNGCSGILVGNKTTARYALTAKHCVGDVNIPVPIRRPGESTTSKRILHAPTFKDNNSKERNIDVALVELNAPMAVPGPVYFTNLDGQQLIGTKVRCFGRGPSRWNGTKLVDDGPYRWGDFIVKNDGQEPGNTLWYYLTVPNAHGQGMAPGDSGGPCIKDEAKAVTSVTVTGLTKGASHNAGVPGYSRQSSAVSFSAWVRQYVPRVD